MDTIGLIAGNTDYPLIFLEAAKKRGKHVVVAAIHGETNPSIAQQADTLIWLHIGQLGKLIGFFKQHRVKQCVMAGGVKKIRIFQELLHIDMEAIRFLMSVKDRTDTSLLGGLCERLKEEGIEVISAVTFLEDMLAPLGFLTHTKPSHKEEQDIAFGRHIAEEVARLDIGLTIVVKDKVVVAVEAVEGTDEAIRRGAMLGGTGCTVIKVARPQQDVRFDFPVIGVTTIDLLKEVGIHCLAVQAHKTILFDRQGLVAHADKAKIAVIGIE